MNNFPPDSTPYPEPPIWLPAMVRPVEPVRFSPHPAPVKSKEVLSEANICGEDIEVELEDGEVRIHPIRKETDKRVFTLDSPLWKCVGFAEAEGISGRNHDMYIYDEG